MIATDYPAFSNLCFTSIAVTSTNAVLGIGWNSLTNTLSILDIYAKTNLIERLWRHLAEMDVDTDDEEAIAELPLSWLGYPQSAFFNLGERLDSDGDGLPDAFETLATGSDPTIADTDGDGRLDGAEVALGTNPTQPDTDGDGMDDGWENEHGFDPTTDNDDTARTDDDFNADPDNDGLINGDECAYGANPFSPDTDDGGVGDAAEVAQGHDPTDGDDDNGADIVRVEFEFGDYSGSHSEKYRLEIKPVSDNRSAPKTHRLLNQRYGETDTYIIPLKPGLEYEVRLRHAATAPDYSGYPTPDYDYRLLMTSQETPPRVILDDPDNLFGTNKSNQTSTFTTSPKVARLYVLKPTVEISKGAQSGWDEMPESEVILSDEDMGIRIKVEPKVPSINAMKESLGDKYTIFTDTKPDGAAVDFVVVDQFVQNASSSEVRIAKTRAQLKALGLLPQSEEDGVNEMATIDTGDEDSSHDSNLTDSEAFNAIAAISRHDGTKYGNMNAEPPKSRGTKKFFTAAGVEYIKVSYGNTTSHSRQIMNQADFFYYSGHGHHIDASLTCPSGESVTPSELDDYWADDIDCAILFCCSILDIGDFVAKRLSWRQRLDWKRAGGASSPGEEWMGSGPKYLLGFGWTAPRDTQGATIIAGIFAEQVNEGKNPIEAWRIATDRPAGRNACAIDVSVSPAKFWYWQRSVLGTNSWTFKTNGVDW